jgi:4-carboxymuconolactone decarboxylase
MSDRFEKGAALIRRLFKRDIANSGLPPDILRHTVEHVFGDVWQGAALAVEERSMITCAVLVALGREHEQRVHFRGARNLGIPREKIEAVIHHVLHYAGWPTGISAARVLAEVWDEMDKEEGK